MDDGISLEIIALGGAGDIGKNMVAFRYGEDMIVVDAGVQFPTGEHPGVDLIIPDITFLRAHAWQIRAIVLTHGHEDHIGALPYVLKDINVPVYGTPLTLGLVRCKLDEHKLRDTVQLNTMVPGDRLEFGALSVEPVRVTHSIPDTVSLAIFSPVGTVIHTGDFKIDQTPIDGRQFDAARFAELGDQGVLMLISDSVNAEKSGWVPTEREVGAVLDQQIAAARGRVLVTTFASNLHRVQQVLNIAEKYGRRVAVAGRSMDRNIHVARELGFLHFNDALRIRVEELDHYADKDLLILTTGSQGETLAALSRIAIDEHKVRIKPGDTVILSSRAIPGKEDAVYRTVNRLFRRGARVVYDLVAPVHVSGHGNQEELKLMVNLTRPRFVAPYHGEPRMMYAYTEMVAAMGMPRDNVIWLEIGDVLALNQEGATFLEPLPQSGSVLVDGLAEVGVDEVTLRDRRHLADNGVVVVTVGLDRSNGDIYYGPELVARGFLHPEDTEATFGEAAAKVKEALRAADPDDESSDLDSVHGLVRDVVSRYLHKKTGLRPIVVPVILEV